VPWWPNVIDGGLIIQYDRVKANPAQVLPFLPMIPLFEDIQHFLKEVDILVEKERGKIFDFILRSP
jgi:hypothetical protein